MADQLKRLRGTVTIVRHLPGQRRAPFARRDRTHEARDARLRAIVRHAARSVPYYRELGLNVDLQGVRTAEDLSRLPLIGRSDVQRTPLAFRTTSSAATGGVVIRTSGTTGQPLDLLHDRASALANIAFAERERAVDTTVLGTRSKYRVLSTSYRSAALVEVRAFYDRNAFRPFRPGFAHVPNEEPLDVLFEALDRVRPDILVAPGSWMEVIFRTIDAHGLDVRLPRIALYAGEAMSDEARLFIENRFELTVLSRYNATESFRIGYLCEARAGFHLHDDLCPVELVDEGGSPVEEGERGEVVISNLVNRGTVLLRYRLGDYARLTSEPCACGRTSSRLISLEGKTGTHVWLPDGRRVYGRALWGAIKEGEGVARFQLVQHERARFEIRLSTVDKAAYGPAVAAILPELRELLPGCEVEATYHDQLRPEPGRKFASIVALPEP